MPRFITIAVLAAAALQIAGCSDAAPADDSRDDRMAELTLALDELRAVNDQLREDVRRQGRQIAVLQRVRAESRDTTAEARSATSDSAADVEGVSEGLGATSPATADDATSEEVAVAAALKTDAGQKAIQAATAREIERREEKERRLFVSYQVGVFARKAGLDERQTSRLQSIWKESMDGGVALRKQFAAIGGLPEADRAEARAQAMQSMRDLGRERREKVRDVLSGSQLEQYEEAEEEIVAGLHGGPRR